MLEVMFAFGLFMVICMSILPFLTTLYQERLTLEEEVQVLYRLEEAVQRYMLGVESGSDLEKSVKKYEVRDQVVKFCSSWTGTNGRDYEHCLLAAK